MNNFYKVEEPENIKDETLKLVSFSLKLFVDLKVLTDYDSSVSDLWRGEFEQN